VTARELPPRDPRAEQDRGGWAGWAEAQGYAGVTGVEYDLDDMRDAFTAGMQAAYDLDSATLAAEVRAGHVRIETGPAQNPQAGRPTTGLEDAMLRNVDGLNDLVRDILQSLPDTADEPEWRDRAGALYVHDPDGQPYRAYTEADL